MEQGTREVTEGLHLVTQAGSSFNGIRDAVDEVSLNNQVVSTALEQMTSRVFRGSIFDESNFGRHQ